jgi:hypothetical protein
VWLYEKDKLKELSIPKQKVIEKFFDLP